ncbi:MAG: hypothetical protein RL655_721, partial [Pseudomonadota bacterium]
VLELRAFYRQAERTRGAPHGDLTVQQTGRTTHLESWYELIHRDGLVAA